MSVRTTIQLQDELDKDILWRRRELTSLRFLIHDTTRTHERELYLRAGVTLLYAHWEGFIKRGASIYLEFLNSRGLPLSQMKSSFLAAYSKEKLRIFSETDKSTVHYDIVEYILSNPTDKFQLDPTTRIKTRSNLKSEVLREILLVLGLDIKPYELRFQIIDGMLLHHRNNIAHGQFLQVDLDKFDEMYAAITELMSTFRTQIENAVALREYLRTA